MRYGEVEQERLYTKNLYTRKNIPLNKEIQKSGVFLSKQEIKYEEWDERTKNDAEWDSQRGGGGMKGGL